MSKADELKAVTSLVKDSVTANLERMTHEIKGVNIATWEQGTPEKYTPIVIDLKSDPMATQSQYATETLQHMVRVLIQNRLPIMNAHRGIDPLGLVDIKRYGRVQMTTDQKRYNAELTITTKAREMLAGILSEAAQQGVQQAREEIEKGGISIPYWQGKKKPPVGYKPEELELPRFTSLQENKPSIRALGAQAREREASSARGRGTQR